MAAAVTGSKTATVSLAPHLPASLLTTLMATAVENLTIAQFDQIKDALNRTALGSGNRATTTLGQVFL